MTNLSTASPPAAPSPTNHLFVAPHGEELIRGELHGLEHLEAQAGQLAAACTLAAPMGPARPLLRRFAENGQVLVRAYRAIAQATRRQEAITPDTEWLLDNFYIVEESLREIKHDLPRGYYAKLPRLAHGPLAGYPRVYALALALVAHTDSSLDEVQSLAVCSRVPDRRAADYRRIVGRSDHAPAGADGKPAAAGRANASRLGGPPPRRKLDGAEPGPGGDWPRASAQRPAARLWRRAATP